METEPYTPPVVPTAEELAEGMRRATLKQVKEGIKAARHAEARRRGSRHAPGATKATVAKRAAQARKRKTRAKASKRQNRK